MLPAYNLRVKWVSTIVREGDNGWTMLVEKRHLPLHFLGVRS